MNLVRIAQRLWQKIACRRLPHGLLSWRYFLPTRDDRIRLHRQLWWQSRSGKPLLPWLLLEGWLWLRWLGYGAWRSTWISVRHYGPGICRSEGISLYRQSRQALSLAMGYCIPASYLYRYGLYLHPNTALDYVFDHETAEYHRWRSRALCFGKESLALLQDKWQQTETLGQLGVPMAPILAKVPRGGNDSLSRWLQADTRLFCKTRSGNCAIGAFTAWREWEKIGGRAMDGRQLKGIAEVESAWRKLLALDDALIQPCLNNHPDLARLSEGDDAITVRFISQWHNGLPAYLHSSLELPAGTDATTGRPAYVVLPLDATGNILPFPAQKLLAQERKVYARFHARLSRRDTIPYWDALQAGSLLAHGHFPDVHAIAWDWVITPHGPVLLEGNSGWGVVLLQQLDGALLRREGTPENIAPSSARGQG